jgi:phytoene dehydrogenase-like protein
MLEEKVTMAKKQPSHHDLANMLEDDDDDEESEDTGMFVAQVEEQGGVGGGVWQAFALYIHRKHSKLAKNVRQWREDSAKAYEALAEQNRETAKKVDRILYGIGGAVFVGGALWKLFEFLAAHISK